MRRIWTLARKEALEIIRQKELLFLILVVPVVEIVILGYVIAWDVRNIPVKVIDESGHPAVARLVGRMAASPELRFDGTVLRTGDAVGILARGEARAVVTFRKPSSVQLPAIDYPEVQILVDGTAAADSHVVAGVLAGIVRRDVSAELRAAADRPAAPPVGLRTILPPEIAVATVFRFNPDLRTIDSQGPGLVGLLLTFITVLLAGLAVVREREMQTLDALRVSRLTPAEIFIGKGLPPAAAGLIHLLVGIPIIMFWFRVPFRGGAVLLLAASAIYVAAAASLALAVSAVSTTQKQAMFLVWYSIMAIVVLSGFFTPLENMAPEAFLSRGVAAVNPFRYLMRIVRAVMLKGAGPEDLTRDIAALAALAAISVSASFLVFRRSLRR